MDSRREEWVQRKVESRHEPPQEKYDATSRSYLYHGQVRVVHRARRSGREGIFEPGTNRFVVLDGDNATIPVRERPKQSQRLEHGHEEAPQRVNGHDHRDSRERKPKKKWRAGRQWK